MKKSGFFLLIVTLIFISFVIGVYVGRNFGNESVRTDQKNPTVSTTAAHTPPTNTTASSTASTQTTQPSKPVFPININTATAEELDLLPDIGPTRAEAIVAYRTEYGPFESVEDLIHVEGIGEKILAKILPYITV